MERGGNFRGGRGGRGFGRGRGGARGRGGGRGRGRGGGRGGRGGFQHFQQQQQQRHDDQGYAPYPPQQLGPPQGYQQGYPPQYPPSQELYQPQYQQYQQPPAQFQQQGYGDDGRGYNNGNPPPPPAPFQPMDNFQQYQQPPQQFQQQQPLLPQQQFQQFQDESPRYSNNPPMPAPPQPQTDYADAARVRQQAYAPVSHEDEQPEAPQPSYQEPNQPPLPPQDPRGDWTYAPPPQDQQWQQRPLPQDQWQQPQPPQDQWQQPPPPQQQFGGPPSYGQQGPGPNAMPPMERDQNPRFHDRRQPHQQQQKPHRPPPPSYVYRQWTPAPPLPGAKPQDREETGRLITPLPRLWSENEPKLSSQPPLPDGPVPPLPPRSYDDGFVISSQYEAHVGTHVTCSDCDFSASKRVVTAHFQTAHGQYAGQGLKEIDVEGQKFMVLVGNSVEDITKWREERRKKWLAMSRQPKPTTTARKLSVSSEEDLEEGEIEEDEEARLSQPDAGVQEPPVKKQRKTMLCKWFSRGNCRFDDAHCKYSHDRSAFGCRAMMYKGSCSKGLYCPFSHDTAVLSGQRERSQKASKERATEQQWRGEQKSLLRKLLAKDVRVEQRKMLQIVHFLVANDLLRSSESEKADVSGQEPAVKIEVLKSEQAEASFRSCGGDNVVPVVEEASACGLESQGVSTSSDTKKENEAVESSHDGDEEEEDTGKDTSASAQAESVNPEEVAAAVAVKDVGLFESASDSGQVPVRQADTIEASANEAC
ncbi:Nuclear fragile X mental retardation-interacting protein 1, conserved domain [Phytophthora cactorum]|nr:Nuclear fragile X mental retardation-interacting protein 1, conserved domain [Phytophthora cactorum]